MTRLFGYKRQISRLLLLTYVLVGVGLGNALLLCQESEAFAHLELNLSGSCENVCPTEEDQPPAGDDQGRTYLHQASTADCLDSQISLSHASTSPKKAFDQAGNPSPAWQGFSHDRPAPSTIDRFIKQSLLAQPPPHQSLLALRTVVLLH